MAETVLSSNSFPSVLIPDKVGYMAKHTSALILSLAIILAMFIYGCCSHSDNPVSVNQDDKSVITSREAVIDELGRMPTVTFPSGARIEALEENTLTPGIIVSLTEQKLSNKSTAYFNPYTNTGVTLYQITAFQNPSNPAGRKTYVSTTEKPFRITLPKPQNSQGIVLVGMKESDTDPWRFFSLTDNSDASDIMAGVNPSESAAGEYSFDVYRMGSQFALITYEGNSGNSLPESFVSSLAASSTASILVKDGKYLEDLQLSGVLKGLKLDSIKPTDLRARITYRNNSAEEAPIKLNGAEVAQTNKADKTVPGYSFVHSFIVDNVTDPSLMNGEGKYGFTINVNGADTQSFPSGFLIEFYNRIDSEKILPYNYSEFYNVKQIESVNLALVSDDGSLADEAANLYKWNPTFSLNSDFEFSDADKERVADSISVSDVDSEKLTKTWNGRVMTLAFTEPLLPNRTYTISMAEVTDLENAVVTPVEDFSFTTIYNSCGYSVLHQQENLDHVNFTLVEIENLTAPENTEVTPSVKTYEGFVSPLPQTILIASDTENSVVYSYLRKVPRVILNKGTGIAEVTGSGFYEFGKSVTASCTMADGYEFDKWTDLDGNEASATFNMPADIVNITAKGKLINYNITYVNTEGCTFAASNPDYYNITSATVTLNNPVKEGYVFTGWSGTGINGTGTLQVDIPNNSKGNREYTANWNIGLLLDIAPNSGSVIDEQNRLYCTISSFTITPITSGGVTLSDALKAELLEAVYVKDEGGKFLGENIVQKSWQNGKISLSFSNDLNVISSYTISCNPIPEITIDTASTLTFKTFYYKGLGTEENPFKVETPQQLDLIRNYKTYHFRQIADISLASFNSWSPIGDDISPFTGSYDGDSRKITSLRICTDQQIQYAGLFGYSAGAIKKLNVDGFYITGGNDSTPIDCKYAGVITGYSTGEITECTVTGNPANGGSLAFGNSYISGMCGCSEGNITSCHLINSNIQLLNHSEDYNPRVGGICGFLQNGGTINDCHVASLTLQSQTGFYAHVGGICGYLLDSSITSCHLVDSLFYCDNQKAYCGGICGGNKNSSIINCDIDNNSFQSYLCGGICGVTFASSITSCNVFNSSFSSNFRCGGNVGSLQGGSSMTSCHVENCIINFDAEDNLSQSLCGGITSLCTDNSNIYSCYVASSTIRGYCRFIGGISGGMQQNGRIESCYIEKSTVTLSAVASDTACGGICGKIFEDTFSKIDDCYVFNSTINGYERVGGICGAEHDGLIASSHIASTTILCANKYIGGICGLVKLSSIINNCYVTNSLIKCNNNYTGGIGGLITSGASVSDCYVENSTIQGGNSYVGGIGGNLDNGSINSCHVASSTVTGNNTFTGGICGFINNSGNISNSYITGSIVQNKDQTGGIGGSLQNSASVTDCYVENSIVQGTNNSTGGIGGNIKTNSSINSCCIASSTVTSANNNTGGIGGNIEAACITSSYVENSIVQGTNNDVGGIGGYIMTNSSISSCHIASSTVISGSYFAGGIGGNVNASSITSCYVDKSQIQGNSYVGGINGYCIASSSTSCCYVADTSIKCETDYAGGISGRISSLSSLADCYITGSSVQGASYVGGVSGALQNSCTASSSYVVNTTIQGTSNTGNICGRVYSGAYLSDCFTDSAGTLTSAGLVPNTYGSVVDYNAFKDLTWSDSKTYPAGSIVWNAFKTIDSTSWPPKLTWQQ